MVFDLAFSGSVLFVVMIGIFKGLNAECCAACLPAKGIVCDAAFGKI